MDYTFNPRDRATIQLFKELGVPQRLIQRGHIDEMELSRAGISVHAFRGLARITPHDNLQDLKDNKDPNDTYTVISPAEAKTLRQLIQARGPHVLALFNPNICPGMNATAADILLNMAGRIENTRWDDRIFREEICPYPKNGPYTIAELEGIHYVDDMIPEGLRRAGRAVVEIRQDKSRGSAVITSDIGDIYTAYHVLFQMPWDEADKNHDVWRGGSVIIGNQKYEIKKEHVVSQDRDGDIIHLRIPGIGAPAHLKPARRIPNGDEAVWVIGFPGQWGVPIMRTYTPGRFLGVGSSGELVTNARGAGGDSGGAFVNSRGELLAVTSRADPASFKLEGINLIPTQRMNSIGRIVPDTFDPVHWQQVMTLADSFERGVFLNAILFYDFRKRLEKIAPKLFTSTPESIEWQVFSQTWVRLKRLHVGKEFWVERYQAVRERMLPIEDGAAMSATQQERLKKVLGELISSEPSSFAPRALASHR